MGTSETRETRFRVLDAMDAPHEGRILRLRLEAGETPTIAALKGAHLQATSPEGETQTVRISGFAVFGGRPSDERLARTGRIDVVIEAADAAPPVGLRWEVRPVG